MMKAKTRIIIFTGAATSGTLPVKTSPNRVLKKSTMRGRRPMVSADTPKVLRALLRS